MWVLVLSICMSIGEAPACGSEIFPSAMQTFSECEDAAVLTHDHIRAAADSDGVTLLSLNTHCFTPAGLTISAEDVE